LIRDVPIMAAPPLGSAPRAPSTVDRVGPVSFGGLVGAGRSTRPAEWSLGAAPTDTVVSRSAVLSHGGGAPTGAADGGELPLPRSAAAQPVQRAAEPAGERAAEFMAVPTNVFQITTAVQRQADPATTVDPPAAATAAAPAAAAEPEELLAQLYDPLLRRIKAELLIGRDRCGSLTDLRR
jgi:hypothetical protein